MENVLLYIMILLLIVNIVVSSYNLSKVIKTEENFDGGSNRIDPCDPNLDPNMKAYLDGRYDDCINEKGLGKQAFCMEWAPKCPYDPVINPDIDDPCDPNLDPNMKAYLDSRYNDCMDSNRDVAYCLSWAPKCPYSSYNLSKEKYVPVNPNDPDRPYYPSPDPQRCKDRYNYCIQNGLGQGRNESVEDYCKRWAGDGCSKYL